MIHCNFGNSLNKRVDSYVSHIEAFKDNTNVLKTPWNF